MAPLSGMEKVFPVLDSDFQSFCASHRIFSVEDFLLHDLDALRAFAKQCPNSHQLTQGILQVLSIIEGRHQLWLNGWELLQDVLQNKCVLSTGFDEIDALLLGGLREGQLTELAGPSSSGKTQFCMRVAASFAEKHSGLVIYMDTSNSFSPQRIEHFVVSNLSSDQILRSNQVVREVMSSIVCHSVFDIFAMFNILHQLEMNLRSQSHGGENRVRLLVIDSISLLITPVLGSSGPRGHALMVSAGVLLKRLAYEHNIAVLVTNHTVAGEGSNPRPALGESWKSISHVRLLITHDRGGNSPKLCILKHPSVADGKAAKFKIDC